MTSKNIFRHTKIFFQILLDQVYGVATKPQIIKYFFFCTGTQKPKIFIFPNAKLSKFSSLSSFKKSVYIFPLYSILIREHKKYFLGQVIRRHYYFQKNPFKINKSKNPWGLLKVRF